MEGDDGDKGSDDAESTFSAELAALVKSGAANDGEVCAFVRRRFFGKKPDEGKRPEPEDSEDEDMSYSPASPGTPMSVQ